MPVNTTVEEQRTAFNNFGDSTEVEVVQPRNVYKWTFGRPLKFKTPNALRKRIQNYFDTTPDIEITISGLALVVGSKQTLSEYAQRDGYAEIIKEARLLVENSYERDLRRRGGGHGNIFALKNFGWVDESTQHVNSQSTVTHVITADERAERVCSMLDTMQRQREVMDNLLPPVIEAERVD